MTRARAFVFGALAALVFLTLTVQVEPEPPREQRIEAILDHAEEWRIDEPDQPLDPLDTEDPERPLP